MTIRSGRDRIGDGGLRGVALLLALAVAAAACRPSQPAKHDPYADAAQKMRMTQAYLRAGRTAEALATMDEAVKAQPGNAGLRNFYGQVCFIAGRDAQAEAAFRKALELDPYLTDAHNNLGALYDRMGRKDAAEVEYHEALKDSSYPTPEKVYLNLGLLYASQGRNDEAVKSFRKAVEIDPKYYQGHFELASLLDRNGTLEEAAREYEVAAPDYQSSGDYFYRLGFAYFRLGDRSKAREKLTRAIEVSPGSEAAARSDEILKLLR